MRKPLLVLGLGVVAFVFVACGPDGTSGGDGTPGADGGGGDGGAGPGPGEDAATDGGGDLDASADASEDAPVDGSGGPPWAVVFSGPAPYGIEGRSPVDATFAVNGALDSYTFAADEAPQRSTAAVYDVLADGIAGTGRWSDGMTGGTFHGSPGVLFNNKQAFHYGYVMRPSAVPAPVAATFAIAKATSPTMDDGTFAPGTCTGSAATAVDGASMRVGLALSVEILGDGTYTVSTTGGVATPSTSAIVAGGSDLVFSGSAAVTGAGAACGGGGACTATIEGIRSASHDRIVIAYAIDSGTTGKAVRGAVVLSKP